MIETFNTKFSEISMTFNTKFSETDMTFNTKFDSAIYVIIESDDIQKYGGEYTVIPKVQAQTMPTKDKVMVNDVTIMAIPYAEVTNNSGGTTATIGGN